MTATEERSYSVLYWSLEPAILFFDHFIKEGIVFCYY